VRAISTDIICQTIVQHCRTSDLELTATCRIKLRLSLSTFSASEMTYIVSSGALNSTHSLTLYFQIQT